MPKIGNLPLRNIDTKAKWFFLINDKISNFACTGLWRFGVISEFNEICIVTDISFLKTPQPVKLM